MNDQDTVVILDASGRQGPMLWRAYRVALYEISASMILNCCSSSPSRSSLRVSKCWLLVFFFCSWIPNSSTRGLQDPARVPVRSQSELGFKSILKPVTQWNTQQPLSCYLLLELQVLLLRLHALDVGLLGKQGSILQLLNCTLEGLVIFIQ